MSNDKSEYKAIVKAIIDNALVDYVKLQHPNNRKKKFLQNAYINSIALLFDNSFKFDFSSQYTGDLLKLDEALAMLMDGQLASIPKTRQHVISETVEYWTEKHFQDLIIPKTVNVCGYVYFIRYLEVEKSYVDKEKFLIVLIKNSKDNDRYFVKHVLDLILYQVNIEINKSEALELQKYIYLFLKINGCFSNKLEESDPEIQKRIDEYGKE